MKRSKNDSQCFGGIAEIFNVLCAGINTLVRLSGWKNCSGESQARFKRG